MLTHRVAEKILKIIHVKNENHTLAHSKCLTALLLLLQGVQLKTMGRGGR